MRWFGVLRCWILGMAALTLLVGCNPRSKTHDIALGPRFSALPPPDGAARVVVYWPSDQWRGSGVKARLLIGGHEIGALEPLGYTDAVIDPGEVSVAVRFTWVFDGFPREDGKNLFVNAREGETVFVRYAVVPGSLLDVPKLSIQQVAGEIGRDEASQTRRVVNK